MERERINRIVNLEDLSIEGYAEQILHEKGFKKTWAGYPIILEILKMHDDPYGWRMVRDLRMIAREMNVPVINLKQNVYNAVRFAMGDEHEPSYFIREMIMEMREARQIANKMGIKGFE